MSEKPNNLYSNPLLLAVVALVVILIGSVITAFYPIMRTAEMSPTSELVKPFSAIELAGRDVYRAEGCTYCHTQVVRPLKADVLRYGAYSKAYESQYDRPFLWGSRRTGPDLARLYNKYSDEWHKQHLLNPKAYSTATAMPAYTWLGGNVNAAETQAHGATLAALTGDPAFNYSDAEIAKLANTTKLDALIAYLQSLGHANTEEHMLKVTPAKYAGLKLTPGDTIAGKGIYDAQCASCHNSGIAGNDFTGGFALSSSDVEAYFYIANGVEGSMPLFINTLTHQQVANVLAYVKSLNKTPAPVNASEEGGM